MMNNTLPLFLCAAMLAVPVSTHAFTTQEGPRTETGAAITDPDEDAENMAAQKNGVSTMNFGNGLSYSVSRGNASHEPVSTVHTFEETGDIDGHYHRYHSIYNR